MESRSQFTFYRSFADALKRIRKKADRADAYDAICNYALYGIEPDMDKLPDAAAIAFDLIRPNLDASKRKAESGKRGGNAKQAESKPQANRKQTASKLQANRKQGETASEKEREIEKEKEKEKEIEIENECCYPPPPTANAELAEVFAAYEDRINPFASDMVRAELEHYVKAVGKEVVLWAFATALDAKKATWPYIQSILRDKERRGVKCLADLQTQGARRGDDKPRPKERRSFSELIAEQEGMT